MYTQGGVTYTPLPNAYGVAFPKGTVCPKHVWGTCPVQPALFGNHDFQSDSPCSFMLSKVKNIFFKCLLKRVIDPSVLNHSICYDNNANRITCQELFLDFFKNNKYDRLIK